MGRHAQSRSAPTAPTDVLAHHIGYTAATHLSQLFHDGDSNDKHSPQYRAGQTDTRIPATREFYAAPPCRLIDRKFANNPKYRIGPCRKPEADDRTPPRRCIGSQHGKACLLERCDGLGSYSGSNGGDGMQRPGAFTRESRRPSRPKGRSPTHNRRDACTDIYGSHALRLRRDGKIQACSRRCESPTTRKTGSVASPQALLDRPHEQSYSTQVIYSRTLYQMG